MKNINSKINYYYYLPKKITNNVDFVNSIYIINSKFNKNEVIRKDYITLSIIKKFKLNETPRWISYYDI